LTSNLFGMMVRRLLGQIIASTVMGVVTMVLLAVVLERITQGYRGTRQLAINILSFTGNTAAIMIGSFLFFLLFMVLLNWRRFLYAQELHRSVAHIAQGNFDHEVPVRQNNDIGLLAENLNLLVERLKRSLDEERRTERSKNELVTNVSHDLRTPLTSIIGYLGLIDQDRYRDEVELRHYVQIAHAKALRLNLLINDLFEYTRMNGANMSLRMTSLNLTEMMNQLLDHYRLALREAGMEGRVIPERQQEQELRIMGDPDKLVRVFENLLANAMMYGKDGRLVDFLLSKHEGWAIVEVVNYGEPIPSGDLPHLFERFYRGDKARSGSEGGGAGLGLAIAKGLLDKHGGTIQAFSDQRSTSFQVRLPIQDPPE
jgi:signal transduction histidine kinase